MQYKPVYQCLAETSPEPAAPQAFDQIDDLLIQYEMYLSLIPAYLLACDDDVQHKPP